MLGTGATSSLLLAVLGSSYLLYNSIKHHTRTGPKLKDTIELYYKGYAIRAMLRLGCWSSIILFCTSFAGSLLFYSLTLLLGLEFTLTSSFIAGTLFSLTLTAYLFCHYLFYTPSLILLSAQFRFSRLDPLWNLMSELRLRNIRRGSYTLIALLLISLHYKSITHEFLSTIILFDLILISLTLLLSSICREPKCLPKQTNDKAQPRSNKDSSPPNIVMIGCDTLRADRLGIANYHRKLTPNIDGLSNKGFNFTNCYTPLARTAPSMASLLTGCWPHNHKIRSNYPFISDLKLPMQSIAEILGAAGYSTAAVGDWAAADLGKIEFGFQDIKVPEDQWNMKYLIRQGSAFIRLFLSLYVHNRFGKKLIPEVYYLAGIPLSKQTGRDCRDLISNYARDGQPFFINYFSSSAHVPFGSDYPYYDLFSDQHYKGESRFLMTSLASPEEIIEKQGLSTDSFDVPQIINLYDGCIRQFDDEVGQIIDHLSTCNLDNNTIVVIYSDHGADFFENGCWGQGNTLLGDDPSNRIPLVIHDPRQTGGVNFNHAISSIDIAPTLLDLAGLKTPSSTDGCTLAPWFKEPGMAEDRPSFQETGVWLGKIPGMRPDHTTYPDLLEIMDIPNKNLATLTLKQEYYPSIIKAKDRSIRDNQWKLIYQPITTGVDYQLFNVQDDPLCTTNVASQFPDVLQKYKLLLDEWIFSDVLMSKEC